MKKTGYNFVLRTVKFLNAFLMVFIFTAVWGIFYAEQIASPFFFWGDVAVISIFAFMYVTLGKVYDAFFISINRVSEMVYSQALSAIISDFVMYVIIVLLAKGFVNPLPLLVGFVAQLAVAVLWCYLANKWYFATFSARRSAVIYDQREGMDTLIGEYDLTKKFDVRFTVNVDECLENIDMLKDIDTVFLSGVHSRHRNVILKYCIINDIDTYIIPRVGDVLMSGARKMHMFNLPIMRVGRYNPTPLYLFSKRAFDLLASGAALLILSPIYLVTAIAIKATDGGPVFYKQQRLTKDGQVFSVLKFRSMRVDAEKDGVARLSTGENDDRITPVGRIIRKVRIDELPQLINILVGDMSIVGPRPERPEISAQYEEAMPEFRLRLQAKAGLTGYAQVYGKYNTTPYDKLQMDLMYIANPSFIEDLRIMFATVKILFMPESTEGIAEGQTIAATLPEKDKETV